MVVDFISLKLVFVCFLLWFIVCAVNLPQCRVRYSGSLQTCSVLFLSSAGHGGCPTLGRSERAVRRCTKYNESFRRLVRSAGKHVCSRTTSNLLCGGKGRSARENGCRVDALIDCEGRITPKFFLLLPPPSQGGDETDERRG